MAYGLYMCKYTCEEAETKGNEIKRERRKKEGCRRRKKKKRKGGINKPTKL